MHDEEQYLSLIRRILDDPKDPVVGRGGSSTKSVFGAHARYSLAGGVLPLVTTKKMFTRGIVEELLWMLRGSTDAKELADKNVHIWDGHTGSEHHEACGLGHYREGDTGPLYGHQWRHFGARYDGCDKNYSGEGVDQIANVIETLRSDPHGRRHVVATWNPAQSNEMVLTPCHCLFQFYIDVNGLSCQMYQRSADVALGVPFNIASYAILTHMVAKAVGVEAYEFIHVIGDAHIYTDHIDKIKSQLNRKPHPFPRIRIGGGTDIFAMTADDIAIDEYKHHPAIKMKMVV